MHVPDDFVDQLGLFELGPDQLSVYDLASQEGEEYTGELLARLGGEARG